MTNFLRYGGEGRTHGSDEEYGLRSELWGINLGEVVDYSLQVLDECDEEKLTVEWFWRR